MTTEITKKQAILLTVLGVVLVLVLFVQFLFRPTLKSISATKEEMETVQQQYNDLVQQSESYDMNMKALEDWRTANAEKTNLLYPLSKPERIDNFLNFVIHACGATIDSYSVSDTLQYYIDGESNLVLTDLTAQEGTEDAAAAAAAAGGENAAQAYTPTGEYRADFTYTMTGDYESMIRLLQFVDRISFLGLTSHSMSSIPLTIMDDPDTEENESAVVFADQYTYTMTISAYMYQDPLKEIEAAREAAASAENAADAAVAAG